MENKNRKLVLHFDARNTVFLADKCYRLTIEKALNTYLSGLVWGETALTEEEKESLSNEIRLLPDDWSCSEESPCLRSPFPGAKSVYKILEKHLVHIPSDRGKLRERLGHFTQTPEGLIFADLYSNHLNMLVWPKEASVSDVAAERFTVKGEDGVRYHYVLPAFLKLITYLAEQYQGEFMVLIRTYGKDGPYILRAISSFLQGLHPCVRAPLINVPSIDHRPLKLKRVLGAPFYTYTNEDGEVLAQDARTIYQLWNDSSVGIIGVVDDFNFWHEQNYDYSAAKPLWFDPEDMEHQHILFDDNIRFEDDGSNVVNVQELQKDSNLARSLSPEDALSFENIFYVQADLLKIISDTDYFVNQVQNCVKNFNNKFVNPSA
ncbi:hypothetical protein Ciccas_004759 [Cichlidogyrus casuarinus]|uniref:Uncharacterized protein n=1 Tax=Cichlidogyrus casuarinus TaxID=1844966 RepID=A0ABD2QAJ8_9PLAT